MMRLATITLLGFTVLSLVPVRPASAALLGPLLGPRFTVEFEKATYSLSEDAGVATLTLVRTVPFLPIGGTSVVRVSSTGGTAANGSDYPAIDVDVTFNGREKMATVEVPLVADDRYEHDETVTFTLSKGSNNTAIGSRNRSTLSITNDDAAPELSLSVIEPAVEGEDARARVTLEGLTDVPAKVDYATADGSAVAWQDYVPATGTVTFPVGTVERSVAVPTIEDEVQEPGELFVLSLSAPVEATIATARSVARINDDDVPHVLVIENASAREGGTAQFTVTLSRPSTDRVYVDYATEDATALAPDDYMAKSGTVTIDPGQITHTISVPTVADGMPEPDEQFTVRLWNARGAAIGNGTAIGTIVDASPLPAVSIGHAAIVQEGGMSSFRLTLSAPSSSQVTVRVTPRSGTASVGGAGSGADVVVPPAPVTATFAPNAVTTDVTFATRSDLVREDPETFRAVLSHASGTSIGTGTATGTIRDDDQCVALTTTERRQVLERWINGLDPDADDDGDGFTNGEELGVLAFDPIADPTRFNPLVADTPTVEVKTIGDLSVALFDKLTEGQEVGRVKITESELIDVNRQEDIHATTEAHEVGASVQGEGGTDQGKKKAVVTVGVDYRYSRSTTDQQTSEVTRGARELRSQEISRIVSSGREIEGGSIAVTVRVTNTGHVAFRVESAPLILRYRDDAGTLLAFGTMVPNFQFGQGPTLSPGQAKDVLYEIAGIGATDALALLEDASSLELGLSDDLELSEIGVGNINVGAGNFAQYQNTIGQNTASLDVDDGRGATDRYLVSTTSFRDPDGRPLGIAMCDAVQVLLQRQLLVEQDLDGGYPVTVDDTVVSSVSSVLLGVGTGGPSQQLVEEDQDVNARWITRAHTGSVSGADYYGPSDVLLRARQATQLVYYRDQDKDKLELRDETIFGTDDTDADSDDDGLDDRAEATQSWQVIVRNRAGETVLDYPVRSDPSSEDVDRDLVPDPAERARGLDPWLKNTDRDRYDDKDDGGLGPSGLAGAYFATGHTSTPSGPTIDLASATPVMVRTDERVEFNWEGGAPASALPKDGFAVRWTGSLVVPVSGNYTLGGVADDGFRLYLNGTKILDNWDGFSSVVAQEVTLNASEPVPIVFEFWEGAGNASAQLLYQDANGVVATVPENWLVPDPQTLDAAAVGLSAEHFFDKDREQDFDDGEPFYKVHDPLGPNHDWGSGSPKSQTVPYDYFMSRWTGFLTLPADAPNGNYTFGGKHDDGMVVSLNDDPVYEQKTTQGSPTYGTPVALTPGQRVPIKVEHWDQTGNSSVELWVTMPNGRQQKVPATWLAPADAFSPFERPIPKMRRINVKNGATNNITVKLTWGNGETGCDEELSGGQSHACQIPGQAFHVVLTIREVEGGDDLVKGGELKYDLPPSKDECYEVTGDLVVGNSAKAC